MAESQTLQSLVQGLAAHGDRPAILAVGEGSGQRWSYAELRDVVMRLAAGLMERGVAPGEPVALLASNRPEWIVARLALIAVGALAVPLDDLITDADLARAIADSGCRRAFTTRDYVPRLEALDRELELFLLDDGGAAAAGTRGWQNLLASQAATLPEVAPEDVAALFYTSGTTGPPKGVPLTHRNIMINLQALREAGFLGPGDHVLLPLPLHHSYPFLAGLLLPLASGATIVLPAGMTGPEIVHALRAGRVTAMLGVPRLYGALTAGIEAKVAARGGLAGVAFRSLLALSIWLCRRFGLRAGRVLFRRLHAEFGPNLALLGCGGAWLDPEVEWKLKGLGWEVLTGYGLVETTSIATFNPRRRPRVGSAGLVMSGVELKIEAAEGKDAGEVLIRGPTVFSGYRNDPEASRAAFTEDGWFRSGDLGYLDADGYLYITGRLKELIVLADGKNITPENVEAVYDDSPFIRELAVLERKGALVALVVPDLEAIRAAGFGRVEDLIRVALAERSLGLPTFQRLSGYAITREVLPRTRLGKYQRHELPAVYARARAGTGAPPAQALTEADRALMASPGAQRLWDWLVARYPDKTLTLDTAPQLDLGVDSLAWLNLSLEMERCLGIRLTEGAIARVMTLRDLLREAASARPARPQPPGAGEAGGRQAALAAEQGRWLEKTGPFLSAFGALLYAVNRLVMRTLFALRVQGLENVPAAGPFVIASNHLSDLDFSVLFASLSWRQMRQIYWGGDVLRLFEGPVWRLVCRALRVFPVDERAAGPGLASGAAVLARGKSLVWFPEGWRSPTGELQPFRPGVGMLLKDFSGPVVPAYIRGTFEAMPRGRRVPRPRPVRVVFGRPLDTARLEAVGQGDAAPARIASALHDAVAALADQDAARDAS